jgi:uncharacterized protein YceK
VRRVVVALLAAMLLAGCATATPRGASGARETSAAPQRCSPRDPDRWAWFCVVGQILYGAAAFFTPPSEVATR